MKGYVQIYTGNGKGKTTASMGLVLRALGAGYSVYFGQFLKNGDFSEIKMLKRISEILDEGQTLTLKQFGEPRFIKQKPRPEDIEAAQKGWDDIRKAVASDRYDLVVAEELNVAVHMKLVPEKEVLELIAGKNDHTELVITGRYATDKIREAADLVSEIKEEKHYYKAGVPARVGIEK